MNGTESRPQATAPDEDDAGVRWPELEALLSSQALFAKPAGLAARALRILIEREPGWFLVDEAGDFHGHVSTAGAIDWDAVDLAAEAWPADRAFLTRTAAAMVRGDVEAAEAQPEPGQLDGRRYATWQAMRAAYADTAEGAEAYLTAVTNSPLAGLGRGFQRYAEKLSAQGIEVPETVMAAAAVLRDPDASPEQAGQAAHIVTTYSTGQNAAVA